MRKEIHINEYVDIEISSEDVMNTIYEMPQPRRPAEVMRAINHILVFIGRITDDMIQEMDGGPRDVIGKFLNKQADRYLPPPTNPENTNDK